jgi:anaerobic selenocysteine-containing dehydrogenase
MIVQNVTLTWAKRKTTLVSPVTNKETMIMEMNRRNFILFAVGGVAGIHLTPIPWKLTDDIAIWTQNWPWVPLPERGAFTHEKSVCKLCPGGCGIEVRKAGERAVKIEGRTDYPINPGGLCPLGMGGLQLLYNKDLRFTSPMKRVGPRGAGVYMDITWEEALDTLAGRISNLREKGVPEAVAAVDGNETGSSMSSMVERLLEAVGSPNYIRMSTTQDTYTMTNWIMTGLRGPMAYDLENAKYILSFGVGLLEGWGAPGRVINAWRLWHSKLPHKRETKIVQVESRASNTASKADRWVAAKPGTEAALAMGLAHVIVKEGLYDQGFVQGHTFGFDDWQSADGKEHTGLKTLLLEKYTPAQVGAITGLSSKSIESLAIEFAKAEAPIAISGKGKGYLNGSLYESMAVQTLNALVGNINQPGGVLICDPLPLASLPDLQRDPVAENGLKKPRLDHAGSTAFPFADSLIHNLTEAILKPKRSPVDTLMVFSANPDFTLPDGGAFREALKKIPFIVSFSPYRDETSYMADLILPDHTYLEKMDDIPWPPGLQYPFYGLSRPVIEPIYDTRNSGDVILQLAKRMDGPIKASFPWSDYSDVIKERARGLFASASGRVRQDMDEPIWNNEKRAKPTKPDFDSFEDMWEALQSGGFWFRPDHKFGLRENLFKTSSGKFEFFSRRIQKAIETLAQENSSEEHALERLGIRVRGDEVCMPHYEEIGFERKIEGYPLRMVPYEIMNLSSGWVPNPPFLYKTLFDHQLRKNDSFAEINPITADEYHLKEGDFVTVESPQGKLQVRVNISEVAMPGIVYLPEGFGHTAYDEFIRGKGVNPHELILTGRDPLSGQPIWWATPVKIAKV